MAGKQKTYDQETRQKLEATLDNLPEKPKSERPLSTKELVTELRTKIRAAQAKGYTLEEVVEFMDQGGGSNPNLSPLVKPLNLTAEEKSDLVAFLKALAGEPIPFSMPKLPK